MIYNSQELRREIRSSKYRTRRDGKGFEIYTAGLEFESGLAPLVRARESRGFIRSPGPTKCAFQEVGFSSNSKKKELIFIGLYI
jgi:hypothetical protein